MDLWSLMGVSRKVEEKRQDSEILYYQDLKDSTKTVHEILRQKIADPTSEITKLNFSMQRQQISTFFHSTIKVLQDQGKVMESELKKYDPMEFPMDKRPILKAWRELMNSIQSLKNDPEHAHLHVRELQHHANTYLKASEPLLKLSTIRK
jgi:hypothetical protein